jgi:hypothetical protein
MMSITSIRSKRPPKRTEHQDYLHSYVREPGGDDGLALFIEVDGTPLLEPCSKRGKRIPGAWKLFRARRRSLLPDN